MSKSKSFLKNFLKPFTSGSKIDQNESDLEKIAAQEQKQFSFETLVAATKNFHSSLKLGEGGFGPVYKGKLDDGRQIAVKKLSQSSSQGKKEFQSESNLLARVSHRNVVNLLGYCVHRTEKLLVYEYVANESLDKILFKSTDKREALDWKRRYDAILGIARGLLYLHEEAHGRIIHRDIKASNILLDEKWTPKIADFGMARLYPEKESHVNTRVAGTNGYMAPEYLVHGQLSTKADVYSFGVVVLELLSGQKNSTFDRDPDSQNLLDWAYKMYKRQRSLEILDPVLSRTADPEQAAMCVQLGLLCVQSDPKFRPNMGSVVLLLSKKPSSLEEPMRPGIPGSRYRRHHRLKPMDGTASSTPSSSGTNNASDFPTFGSSAGTQSSTMSAGVSSTERLDPRGKRPVKD